MEACAKVGAILGGGSVAEINALAFYGRRLGYLLALRDDVKDSMNKEGNLQNRLAFESLPLPLLFAARSSEKALQRMESILKKTSITGSEIGEIVELCFETGAFEKVGKIATYQAKQSARSLSAIRSCFAKEVLDLAVDSFLDETINLFS